LISHTAHSVSLAKIHKINEITLIYSTVFSVRLLRVHS